MKRLAMYVAAAYSLAAVPMLWNGVPWSQDSVEYGQFQLNGAKVDYLVIKSGEKIKALDFKIYSPPKEGSDIGSPVIKHQDGFVTKTMLKPNPDSPTGYEPIAYNGPDSLNEEEQKAVSDAKSIIRKLL